MKASRLFQLSLGDPGQRISKTWPLLFGLVFGVATWVLLSGWTRGLSSWLQSRVGGSLPNRIRVSSAKTDLGPLQLGGELEESHLEACRKIPGVASVFRQAHFPGPCQLWARYGGKSFTTDLILEGVDPGQIAEQLPEGAVFADTQESEIPAVIPQPILEVLNTGITAHTDLPNLSPQALIGRGFDLRVGASSFAPGGGVDIRCRIVAVSDQLGFNGPAVPLDWLARHSPVPLRYHTLTLQLEAGADAGPVLQAVRKLGLSAPDLDLAQKISQGSLLAQLLATLFAGSILMVAGVGIASSFTVKLQLERSDIGLYRSLGASQRDILGMYLLQAAWLGIQGSGLGILLGGCLGLVSQTLLLRQLPASLSQQVQLFQPSWLTLMVALGFTPLVALASAWLPARQAARLQPGRILRGS